MGANCRGVSKTDAMGMAYFGADGRWRLRGGIVRVAAHTKNCSTPRSTQVQGPREEVRPLLLPFSVYYVGFPGLQNLIRVEPGLSS